MRPSSAAARKLGGAGNPATALDGPRPLPDADHSSRPAEFRIDYHGRNIELPEDKTEKPWLQRTTHEQRGTK